MAYKWRLLLNVKRIYMRFKDVFSIYYICTFLGLFLPPTIGADVLRIYLSMRKSTGKTTDLFSSVLIERIVGFLVLVFLTAGGIIFIFFLSNHNILSEATIYYCAIVAAIFVVLAIFLFNSWPAYVSFKLYKRFKKYQFLLRIFTLSTKTLISFVKYRKHPLTIFYFSFLTIIETFQVILSVFIIASSLGVNIGFIYFLAYIPVMLFLTRLPISIDGFGIHEGTITYFLSMYGVDPSMGLAVGIANHFMALASVLPGGIIYLYYKGAVNKVPHGSNSVY